MRRTSVGHNEVAIRSHLGTSHKTARFLGLRGLTCLCAVYCSEVSTTLVVSTCRCCMSVLQQPTQPVSPPEQQLAPWSTSFAVHQQHGFASNCVLPQTPVEHLTLARPTVLFLILTHWVVCSTWAQQNDGLRLCSHHWYTPVDGYYRLHTCDPWVTPWASSTPDSVIRNRNLTCSPPMSSLSRQVPILCVPTWMLARSRLPRSPTWPFGW